MPASAQRSILIVDDEDDDIVLTKLGLERAGLRLSICSVPGGAEAIAFLNGDPHVRTAFATRYRRWFYSTSKCPVWTDLKCFVGFAISQTLLTCRL